MNANAIIVDDHPVFRQGLRILLRKHLSINVTGEASNGNDFLEMLKEPLPDLVFMDISMDQMDGVKASRLTIKKYPSIKIIILTTHEDIEQFNELIEIGVKGYLLKTAEVKQFQMAVDKALKNQIYYADEMITLLSQEAFKKNRSKPAGNIQFTNREEEVLQLICKGYSNKQISEKLFVSVKAIEKQKSHLLEKTGTNNSLNLVIFAVKNSLVNI